jgi:uncharacterized protein YjiK
VEVVSERSTGIREASGVAPLADGSFLLVDDEEGVFRVVPGREPEPVAAGRGFADLEGICVDRDGSRAWVLAERDGAVWSFEMKNGAPTNPSRLGTLPSKNKNANAGWEGLSFAPAGTLADAPRLVAAHQRKPRCIAVVDIESLACERTYRLPKAARKALDDLNDLAVHPVSGELVVLSGKAGRLARLVMSGDELLLAGVHAVEASDDDVPEGIAFDTAGRLWMVWDGSGRLREVRLP